MALGFKTGGIIRKDYSGEKIFRLTILSDAENYLNRLRKVNCICDCNTLVTVYLENLKRGLTKSCGCYFKEAKHNFKHGMSKSKERNIWNSMIQRCHNKNTKAFKNYGARGITVCDEWKNDFEIFYNDMGPKIDGISLDRIDNDKGYSKKNCRWATRKQQANNRRCSRVH